MADYITSCQNCDKDISEQCIKEEHDDIDECLCKDCQQVYDVCEECGEVYVKKNDCECQIEGE